MQTQCKFLTKLFSLFLLVFLWNGTGYSQMSPDLKQFLESRSFPELINTYKKDQLSLFTEGQRAKAIASRPYTVGKGYRCQVFASTQLESAEQVAAKVRALEMDSVYVIHSFDDNLYKVQVGNFDNRKDAEILLDKLRYAKVQGAWIVETDIHVPRSPEEVQEYQEEQIKQQELEAQPGFYYAIQLFATGDSIKAFQMKTELENSFTQPVQVINHQSTWKVLMGKFTERSSAEEFLKALKKGKFKDAWITQVVTSG